MGTNGTPLGKRAKVARIGADNRDFLTPTQRSDLMRRIRSSQTEPESLFATALRDASLAFEANCADIPGKPDIVFRNKKLAVFIDGEFWHGGQWRKRGHLKLADQFSDIEKQRRWTKKIDGNTRRDLARTADLLAAGWTVIRFWADQVQRDTLNCVRQVQEALLGSAPLSPASYLPRRDVAEFFAGIGLANLGLRNAGWNVRYANDFASDKLAFYKENIVDPTLTLDGRDILKVTARDVPAVALATACFPCTDLSLAGAQRGLEPGTESSAYFKFTELLRDMGRDRPPFVLLENVVGMIHSRGGTDFRICLEQLRDAGYSIDAFVLDAKWFVPQSRPRLFVVAVRNDLRPSGHVAGTQVSEVSTLRPKRLVEFVIEHPSLPWSIRSLPTPVASPRQLKDVLQKIPDDDERWWTAKRARQLYKQMSDEHRKKVRLQMKGQRPHYNTVFRRMRYGKSMAELRSDGLAGCLRTPKGGSARQILFRVAAGRFSARLLTPRECGRLMGADSIRIPRTASLNTALFAFGDGVCVPVVQWIADHYLTPLAAELIRGRVLRSPTIH